MTDKNQTSPAHVRVLERAKTQLKPPPMYCIFLLNDDYTPMDFVVEVLQRFFFMSYESATDLTQEIHQNGCGTCGLYTRDIAETKVVQVNEYARRQEHPLFCQMKRN